MSGASLPHILVEAGVTALDPELLTLALTHASKNRHINNERLEFLGDRVLSLVLAEMIYSRYQNESEGDLALRHAALARADMLVGIARDHGLAADIKMAGGEAALDNALADALEALIGAVYLDQGFSVARDFVIALWTPSVVAMTAPPRDPKTILQEWAQGRGLPLPVYELIGRTGPDHAPEFTVEVQVPGQAPACGTGATRRLAEKAAATTMIAGITS
jgi:ribonuclease-3